MAITVITNIDKEVNLMKRFVSVLLLVLLAINIVIPVSASESGQVVSYTAIVNGEEKSFDTLIDAENYIKLAYNGTAGLEKKTEDGVALYYVPCPVGPGPCGKNTLLGSIILRDNQGNIVGEEYYYGCAMCGKIDHKKRVDW